MTEFTTAAETAEQAAEAIRTLNHSTHPSDGAPGLKYPSDVYAMLGELASMAHRLPQLLDQSSGWLEHHVREIEVHGGMFDGDPVAAVATAQAVLADAVTAAQALARHLDDAHNVLAALASTLD